MSNSPTPQEKALLAWFETELKARLSDPDRIVTESSAVEFADVERKALTLGLDDFAHGFRGRDRWEEIGGYRIGARIIRAWRKANGVKAPPRYP